MRSGSSPNEISGSSGVRSRPAARSPSPSKGSTSSMSGSRSAERVDGEVPARQVHREVVAEGDLGLARIGHVDLGPVGRDLVDLRALAAADGPEALALRPDVVGPALHEALGLGREGVGGQVEVVRGGGAGGPGEQGVADGAAHQGEAPPGRGEAARHLFGGLDVGAEPLGNGRGLHPPTVVRPLASPCVDAPGQDRPLHARGGRRSPGQHAGRRRRRRSGAGARRRCAARAGLPDPLGQRRPALVQPRPRRVPAPRARRAACRST